MSKALMSRPEIIEIVGVDGSGKSTLLSQLLSLARTRTQSTICTIAIPPPPEHWFRSAARQLESTGPSEGIELERMLRHALAWRERACHWVDPGDCSTVVFDRHVIGRSGCAAKLLTSANTCCTSMQTPASAATPRGFWRGLGSWRRFGPWSGGGKPLTQSTSSPGSSS